MRGSKGLGGLQRGWRRRDGGDGGVGMGRDEGERDGYGEGSNGRGEGVVLTHLGLSSPLSNHAC